MGYCEYRNVSLGTIKFGNSWAAKQLSIFQEGLSYVKLASLLKFCPTFVHKKPSQGDETFIVPTENFRTFVNYSDLILDKHIKTEEWAMSLLMWLLFSSSSDKFSFPGPV